MKISVPKEYRFVTIGRGQLWHIMEVKGIDKEYPWSNVLCGYKNINFLDVRRIVEEANVCKICLREYYRDRQFP